MPTPNTSPVFHLCFLALLALFGLAACSGGGGGLSGNTPPPSTAPTITLVATPAVTYNTSATISWSSTNSASCTSSPSGINATAGSFTTLPLAATTTYTATCVGPGGSASTSVTIAVTSTGISDVAAACAAEPMRGNVYYYCDCGTGAEADCVAGNDANAGTSTSAPRQTIGNAETRFGSLAVNDTVALCKGGAFNASGSLDIGSNRCGAGVACNDLREYTPTTFTGTAKPLLNNAAGDVSLIRFSGVTGGVRVLNLKLNGNNTTASSRGVFLYSGAHDVTMCNLDIDGFDIGVYNESGNGAGEVKTNNIKLTGSNITNSRNMGFLGGGDNTQINYNSWVGNGSQTIFNHAVYFASNYHPVANIEFIGNHVSGQYGPVCNGVVVTGHIPVDGFRVENNTVEIDIGAATAGCWGIGFGASGYTPRYLRNATLSNNIVKNGGSVGLTAAECPGCVVENNLIIQDWPYAYHTTGILISADSITAGNDRSDVNKVRNNTVWFGPNATNGGIGIAFGTVGTGHTVVNNTVNYSATTTGNTGGVNCFDYPNYPNVPGAYTFINNNHCASAAPYSWAAGRTLAAWRTYSAASGFDTASFTGNPLFTAAGTNFTPAAGSPLIGTGNSINGSVLDITGRSRPNPPTIGAFEP